MTDQRPPANEKPWMANPCPLGPYDDMLGMRERVEPNPLVSRVAHQLLDIVLGQAELADSRTIGHMTTTIALFLLFPSSPAQLREKAKHIRARAEELEESNNLNLSKEFHVRAYLYNEAARLLEEAMQAEKE